jgi:hypothetical protein
MVLKKTTSAGDSIRVFTCYPEGTQRGAALWQNSVIAEGVAEREIEDADSDTEFA